MVLKHAWGVSVLLATAALPAAAQDTAGAGMLHGMRAEVTLAEAQVQVRLQARMSDVGRAFPLTALAFTDAAPQDLVLVRDGRTIPLAVRAEGRRWMAEAPAVGLDTAQVELRYVVPVPVPGPGDADARAAVPLFVPGTGVGAVAADFFTAEIRLASNTRLVESFPSGFRADGEGRYRLDLSTMPALVRVRARPADASALTGVGVFEALVVAVIAGVGMLGWRHLRRSV
ncbi:MAG: hypothetical protein R3E98_10855 [Gemmatimonadota bacterium]|nr:hypothetical protein [Gemmatimonadota bacterium]